MQIDIINYYVGDEAKRQYFMSCSDARNALHLETDTEIKQLLTNFQLNTDMIDIPPLPQDSRPSGEDDSM